MEDRYMRRAGKHHIQGVLRAVLVCGMSVQIALGLAWLFCNAAGLQRFQESMALLEGRGLDAGYYSGILYRWLAALLSSRLWVLYGIQLAAAYAAACGLMACFAEGEKWGLRLFGALALTAIPQAMQCHLAVLPWSLGTSLLAGETVLWRRVWQGGARQGKKEERKRDGLLIGGMLAGWLLLLLTLPVYAWFVLPLLSAALWRVVERGWRGRLVCGLTVLMLCLCNVTVNYGWNAADWNRSLAAGALSRTGWPCFQDNYDMFPYRLHEDIGLVTAREVSAYADGVERVLIPRLEEQYGAEGTTAALWELAGICLRGSWETDVKNIIWDTAAYHASPPILIMQLKGRAYDAYSGINYEQMRTRSPLLTGYYVTYGGRWWWMMLALAAVIRLIGLLPGGDLGGTVCISPGGNGIRGRGREFLRYWVPVLIGMEWLIISRVLGGSGSMDYKQTLWVTMLWYVMALSQLADGKPER